MLTVAGTSITNPFQLIGESEDSITRAIAWALAQSPVFFTRFLRRAGVQAPVSHENVELTIHRYERGAGITDLELFVPGQIHLIVEAKKGWILPHDAQLLQYAGRNSFRSTKASIKRLVTLSECSAEYAKTKLPSTIDRTIPVAHVSWSGLIADLRAARLAAPLAQKRLLHDLSTYIGGFVTQRRESNLVYVVSLGSGSPVGWSVSWIDIVEKHQRYFHEIGGTWPKVPPTYMAFRYKGQLQSVRFVESYEVVDDLKKAFPDQPSRKVRPQFLYKLGPAIVPAQRVQTGAIYPSGRVWCAIDALLTSQTIAEARDRTQARMNVA
jgi:hypothetical protein